MPSLLKCFLVSYPTSYAKLPRFDHHYFVFSKTSSKRMAAHLSAEDICGLYIHNTSFAHSETDILLSPAPKF